MTDAASRKKAQETLYKLTPAAAAVVSALQPAGTALAQENNDDMVIVKSIIDLAHNLGLSVVAEGVETQKILNELSLLHCDIIQGYLFGPACPLPSAAQTQARGR